jgi:hypothetical protein
MVAPLARKTRSAIPTSIRRASGELRGLRKVGTAAAVATLTRVQAHSEGADPDQKLLDA